MPYADIKAQKEYQRAWHQRNKEAIKLKTNEYYKLNPKNLIKKRKKYQNRNRLARAAYNRAYKLMIKEKENTCNLRSFIKSLQNDVPPGAA